MNDSIRSQFPSLSRTVNGRKIVHLDGPAGTQVPKSVIDAITSVYTQSNANTHGQFVTSMETDELIQNARNQMAVFLGAESGNNISFGANMTSMNFVLANAIGRSLQPGDEILITQLDHEANRGPWLQQRKHGIVVREVLLDEDGSLDYADLEKKVSEKTRVIAMGLASNIFGTVNEIERVRQMAYESGALLVVDAVHFAPHLLTDVKMIDCDFLLCSAYKFYGPHVGVLYSRHGALDRLDTDRLRTQEQHAPHRIERGTLNHAGLAGVAAAVSFIESFGEGSTQRDRIISAMGIIQKHERGLAQQLYLGLRDIDGIDIYGPPLKETQRAPTLAFTVENYTPEKICKMLAEKSICAWDGHFYALRAVEVLGLISQGGVSRMGISVYNTADEIEYVIETLNKLLSK
ncbi:MAG TPA: cysteine desulfurase-like protein [Saprospiraceae bacterium]|nr:cysteine desulfurase-like protein [Saprospiraceae bacterium]